ncbi:Mpo1 family 2-hydroxy fatty acid dioxygenase [Aestuariibaculum suncheonense]|uniref:DUF962 domain-containing protein n=1 Tax=Aestuariibaculum suncheonense TaxID=1028745 RepID=A0A8J6QE99_9FLAO|nr:Mpo1-like protein [Aestuariibaculum suncheonense]MBD0834246.1 DUF962 domain-containing protein [Aestuariibaculum suncheonense]
MRTLDSLLAEYSESHQTTYNKRIHYVCVPAIFFSIVGLLACIPVGNLFADFNPEWLQPYLHVGTLGIFLVLLYYLKLSFRLFLVMFVFSVLILLGIELIDRLSLAPLWLKMLLIFAIAWVFQFIGHYHEGKKPSFLKDLQFLLIGPAWTMSHLFKF